MDVETPIHFYRDNRRVEEPIHFATYRQSRGPKPRNKPLHLTPSHFRRQQCSTRSYIGKKPQVSHRSHIAVEMAQPSNYHKPLNLGFQNYVRGRSSLGSCFAFSAFVEDIQFFILHLFSNNLRIVDRPQTF